VATITRHEPEVVTPPPTYTLELSEAELNTVLALLYGGSPIQVECAQKMNRVAVIVRPWSRPAASVVIPRALYAALAKVTI
jgi:hypothetical protein